MSHHAPAVFISAILLACVVLFHRLKIAIEDETLCASFGPGMIRKRVRLTEIVECEPIRSRWWYGWGINLTPYGWLYNVSGFDAVAITLRESRKKSHWALMSLTRSWPQFETRLSVRSRGDSHGRCRAGALRRLTTLRKCCGYPQNSRSQLLHGISVFDLYFASWRNQPKATEVWPSFTSCPP